MRAKSPRIPRRLAALAVAAAVALVAGSAAAAPVASAQGVGTAPVGSAPVLPSRAQVEGPLAGQTSLNLTVVLQPRDPIGLAALAAAVSDPASASYRAFVTPAEFAARFAPAPATIGAVRAWLKGAGLTPGPVSANGLAVAARGPAAAVQAAFGVVLRQVRLAGGRMAYASDAAPKAPARIAPDLAEVVGLDNLTPVRPVSHPRAPTAGAARPAAAAVATAGPQPCAAASTAASNLGGYTANQIARAYSFGSLYNRGVLGSGVSVGIVEFTAYKATDISTFQTCYGTSAAVTNVAVDGGTTDTTNDVEAVLDIQGVISLAPQAAIAVYEAPPTATDFDMYNQIVSANAVKVIATSWGNCEAAIGSSAAQAQNTLFQEAATQGQSVLAATGDNGSEDCQPLLGTTALAVDNPSSQPFVTAIGGTSMTAVGPAPTESVWNDRNLNLGATGGGVSSFWTLPPAQHGPGVVNAYSTRTPCGAPTGSLCRQTPDVSASADPLFGYMIYYTGSGTGGTTGWQTIAGTSAAVPVWAALIALSDQGCACQLGFLNTGLYNIAAAGSGAFNDVVVGNNDYTDTHSGAFPATSGYDMATGLGSPVAAVVASRLNPANQAPAFVAASPPASDAVNSPYTYTFVATGRPAPTFAVTSGSLPTGLSLNSGTGVLAGRPTAVGSFNFTVQAANGIAPPAAAVITITIIPTPSLPGYTPVVPVRICDTRAAGPGVVANQCDVGGHRPLSTSGSMSVTVAGVAGVPANATAAVLHVTTTAAAAASFLTVWQAGQARPTAANLTWLAGQTAPNLVQVGLGAGGQVSLFNYAGAADVVIDLDGYFAPSTGALFKPLDPVRICDTRQPFPGNQCNANGIAPGTLGPGSVKVVNVTAFGLPASATAAVLNVTATGTSAASYFTVWPAGAAQPLAAGLTWTAGQTISNRLITAIGSAGNVEVFNAFGNADVVIDMTGYFSTDGSGAGYFPIAPVRLCDTRPSGPGVATNPCDATGPGTLAGGKNFVFGGLPANQSALVTNVTVTNTAAAGYLTVFPETDTQVPLAADLTWSRGQTIGNLVVPGLTTSGSFVVFNGSAASTDVVIDEDGYYSAT